MLISNKLFFLGFLCLFAASAAWSGTSTHGGKVVICTNQEVDRVGNPRNPALGPVVFQSIQLADYWEWMELTGLKVDLGPVKSSVEVKIRFVLDRLAEVDPNRARRLHLRFNLLQERTSFVSRSQLNYIDDAQFSISPDKTCFIHQAAMQSEVFFSQEKKFLIDDQIYHSPLLSDVDRAGLLLHEIIYEDRIAVFGDRTSDNTRYFTFFISSDRARDFRIKDLEILIPYFSVLGDLQENPVVRWGMGRKAKIYGVPFEMVNEASIWMRSQPETRPRFEVTNLGPLSTEQICPATTVPAVHLSNLNGLRISELYGLVDISGDCTHFAIDADSVLGTGCIGDATAYAASGRNSLQKCKISIQSPELSFTGNAVQMVEGPYRVRRIKAFDTIPGHHFYGDWRSRVELIGAMAVRVSRSDRPGLYVLCRPDFTSDCRVLANGEEIKLPRGTQAFIPLSNRPNYH